MIFGYMLYVLSIENWYARGARGCSSCCGHIVLFGGQLGCACSLLSFFKGCFFNLSYCCLVMSVLHGWY